MKVDLFDFELPPGRIAERPARPRDAARLLVLGDGPGDELVDATMAELADFLRPGDLLVVNDTKVLPAQLTARNTTRPGAARIELTLHKRLGPDRWAAFARPARKLAPGDVLELGEGFTARVETREGPEAVLVFEAGGEALMALLARFGEMPLPPYIRKLRAVDEQDESDYQTVYAAEPGAVAAPTAGLHFTNALFERLAAAGVGRTNLTLHVGAGTFLPVSAEDTEDHRMHAEFGQIGEAAAAAINDARAAGGRIVAVGTTCARLLESAADADGVARPFMGETDIFLTPGYRFRAIDGLVTNFHLPRSTLFMLVASFAGLERMRAAYAHAIAAGYRFYSYGDCTLLFPERS